VSAALVGILLNSWCRIPESNDQIPSSELPWRRQPREFEWAARESVRIAAEPDNACRWQRFPSGGHLPPARV